MLQAAAAPRNLELVPGTRWNDPVQKENAVKAVLDAIADGVRRDETVQLIGFGTFKVSHRAARMGRNPKTGEAMQINASKSVKFSPSAAFKKSL